MDVSEDKIQFGRRFKKVIKVLLRRPVDSAAQSYSYSLDSPKRSIISTSVVSIRGWLIPSEPLKVKAMRAVINDVAHEISYGLERLDVMKARPQFDSDKARFCGFELETEFEDGIMTIEADFGKGFIKLEEKKITYSPEKLFDSYFNPNLAQNWAEHQLLLENKKAYYHENDNEKHYIFHEDDSKLIALYLPQFHPIKENDEVWGKGFTEWTNTTTAQPRFVGHQQPILPGGLGFYDLRVENTIYEQMKLAKRHGVYAFCFYYYWFSGRKLLDKPLETFLAHKDWDFNFMICWANENWTKRWDGRSEDVIVAQKYLKSDPLDFIKTVEPILLDKRYIRQNGKPVLGVYRGSELGDPKKYIKIWRDYFKKRHGLELEIVTMLNFDPTDPRPGGFDAGIEFAPLTHYRHPQFNKKKSRIPLLLSEKLIDIDFSGYVADYRAFLSQNGERPNFDFPTYLSVSPSWDNEARKKGKGSLTLYGSNPDLYGQWLDESLTKSASFGQQLIFINAWNEWAEGATLEPTLHAGYAILNRTSEILAKHSKVSANRKRFPLFGFEKKPNTKLAVIIHLFYEDRWQYFKNKLDMLSDVEFDLYITVTKTTEYFAGQIRKDYPQANIITVPNRGRDILPFLFIAGRLRELGYKYVLKLHSKKSKHREDGDKWFEELIDNLLPSKQIVSRIIEKLEEGVGLVGPKGHYIPLRNYVGRDKKRLLRYVEDAFGQPIASQLLDQERGYFAGSMIWARLDALDKLLNFHLIPEDFESEKGQIDGTLAHSVERLLTILTELDEQTVYQSSTKGIQPIEASNIIHNYKYARNSKDVQ